MKLAPLMIRVGIAPTLLAIYPYEDLKPLLMQHFSGDWGWAGCYCNTHLTPVEVAYGKPTRDDEDYQAKLNKLICDGLTRGGVISNFLLNGTEIVVRTDYWGKRDEMTTMIKLGSRGIK